MDLFLLILSGALVGFAIGLTGVGDGITQLRSLLQHHIKEGIKTHCNRVYFVDK